MKTQPVFRVKLAFRPLFGINRQRTQATLEKSFGIPKTLKSSLLYKIYRRRSGKKYAEWNKLMQQLFVRRK